MRNQKQVDKLTEEAKGITFPCYPTAGFQTFRASLREVLSENGLPGRDLEYDDNTQTFFWEATHGIVIDGFHALATSTFTLDPRKPLREEIERLKVECERFGSACMGTRIKWDAEQEIARAKAAK
jgi:hypothetical protein